MQEALPALHFNRYGSGRASLLILHGFLGSSGNWHSLARNAFGSRFQVFALDARHHGRSPHPPGFSHALMAGDVQAFMDAQGLEDAVLLGHSMGGKTAMTFALAHPERTRALVVADMAPRAYPPHHTAILDALNGVPLDRLASRQEVDAWLARRIPDWGVRQFLLKSLAPAPGGGYRWLFNLPVLTEQYAGVVEAVPAGAPYTGPALFVRGEKSDYVTERDRPDIEKLFPAAELVTIPDAGHWVHAEAPDAFARAVLSFLDAI